MKILKEYVDGFRFIDGNTSSVPFKKGSDTYNEKLAEGFELELMPQTEKDAYAKQQTRDTLLAELAALDLPSHTIERALAGDEYAMELVKTNEAKKAEIRDKL